MASRAQTCWRPSEGSVEHAQIFPLRDVGAEARVLSISSPSLVETHETVRNKLQVPSKEGRGNMDRIAPATRSMTRSECKQWGKATDCFKSYRRLHRIHAPAQVIIIR